MYVPNPVLNIVASSYDHYIFMARYFEVIPPLPTG